MSKHLSTANQPFLLSSDDVARIFGVNVATVKRWTEGGKLGCIKTAGGHRKFELHHLTQFAQNHEKYARRLTLLPMVDKEEQTVGQHIMSQDYAELTEDVYAMALDCEHGKLTTLLQSFYMMHQDLVMIYEEILGPVLVRIGQAWADGQLTETREHMASQTIRDAIIRLQAAISPKPPTGDRVLVINFSEELHDIAAKMVQHVLEAQGVNVMFSGQKTPLFSLEKIIATLKPKAVYLSIVYVTDLEASKAEFQQLMKICKAHKAELIVGGRAASALLEADEFPISSLGDIAQHYS